MNFDCCRVKGNILVNMVLKYFCFGNGIGSSEKALANLGINAICVGISETDIESIIVNFFINYGSSNVAVPSREEMKEILLPYHLKYKGKNIDLLDLPCDILKQLYIAHIATKNMGDVEHIQSLPNSCDLVVYCFNNLDKLSHVKRILQTTPNKPKVLLLATFPKNSNNLSWWIDSISSIGYHSFSYTLKATECGIPSKRGRHFIMSNLKPFSMDFSYLKRADILPLTNFLREEGVETYVHSPTTADAVDLSGLLPPGNVKILDLDGRVRFLTPLEHYIVTGFNDNDYMNIRIGAPYITSRCLIRLSAIAVPVYLFHEIYNNIFVAPLSTITTTLRVPSSRLEKGKLAENITAILREKYEKKCCSKSYGFISEIVNLKEIIDARISDADSSNLFSISYTIRSIKPRLNNIYVGEVKACYSTGIIASIKTFEDVGFLCNVLILTREFDKKLKQNSFSSCLCVFSKGDFITFQITELDYDLSQHTFLCIGAHKCS